MRIQIDELERLVRAALAKFGYPPEEVSMISEVLMYAQLRGSNQGIAKLVGPGLPRSSEAGLTRKVKETRASALIDGAQNAGIVVMTQATDLAVEKARDTGIGIVGTYNTSSSTGAAGFYVRRLANEGFVGVASCGSPAAVSAFGSYAPLFGTNPIAFGFPSREEPVVFDMATSAISWYGLVEANAAGHPIPEGVAYDADGKPTTDAGRAMGGAIRPFQESPKGSGLALVVEVLTGPLVGGAFAGVGDDAGNWGNLVIAIAPDLLVGEQEFRTGVSELMERVKDARRLDGVEEIFLPGERGNLLSLEVLEAGEIDIEDVLLNQVRASAS